MLQACVHAGVCMCAGERERERERERACMRLYSKLTLVAAKNVTQTLPCYGLELLLPEELSWTSKTHSLNHDSELTSLAQDRLRSLETLD